MPRSRPIKRRNNRKHLFANELGHIILQPKVPTARVPIDWKNGDDGEDTPVFAIEYAYTSKDLAPYKAYPRLFRERKYIRRPLGLPFPFLDLPAELRVEVYRHCLKSLYPIDYNGCTLRIDERDILAVRVLRTCKRIHGESAQVFYGEICFRFWEDGNFLRIGGCFKIHFVWLKELTVSVPFFSERLRLDGHASKHSSTVSPEDRIVHMGSYRVDFEANRLTLFQLDVLANAPCLRKLHLVIPPSWRVDETWRIGDFVMHPVWEDDDIPLYLHRADVWEDLSKLFRHRPSLEVTVTRLYYEGQKYIHQQECERFLRKLRYRLGIWDQREAEVFAYEQYAYWTMPKTRTEQHPDEWLRDLRFLFGSED